MKERMKKLISIKSIPILALALLVVLGSALAAGRDPVSGSGEALLNLGTIPPGATGMATLIIGGETLEATFTLTMLSQAVNNGALHITATHTFELPGGTIITSDKGVLALTTGTLSENLTITEGTGDYYGACGELSAHGQVRFRESEPWLADVSFEVRGVISR